MEDLLEELHLESECFLDLLILREELSPSQLLVIQTEHSIIYIMFYYCLLIIKNVI